MDAVQVGWKAGSAAVAGTAPRARSPRAGGAPGSGGQAATPVAALPAAGTSSWHALGGRGRGGQQRADAGGGGVVGAHHDVAVGVAGGVRGVGAGGVGNWLDVDGTVLREIEPGQGGVTEVSRTGGCGGGVGGWGGGGGRLGRREGRQGGVIAKQPAHLKRRICPGRRTSQAPASPLKPAAHKPCQPWPSTAPHAPTTPAHSPPPPPAPAAPALWAPPAPTRCTWCALSLRSCRSGRRRTSGPLGGCDSLQPRGQPGTGIRGRGRGS